MKSSQFINHFYNYQRMEDECEKKGGRSSEKEYP